MTDGNVLDSFDVYEPTDTEYIIATIFELGNVTEDGGELGEADFEDALTADSGKPRLKVKTTEKVVINQRADIVTGTLVGAKIDRIG